MGNTEKFDSMADRYENAERIKMAKLSSDAMREYLVDTKKKHGMDFGCGTGLIGMDLLEEFQSMLFLDTSQKMLQVIDQKISDGAIENARTLCFDFETSSHSKIQVDYIFMVHVLIHIQDFESVLEKLFQTLTVDGHLQIVDFNHNEKVNSELVHSGFDQEKLKEILTKIGFKDIQSKTFYTGEKLFMGQDASLFVLDAKK